MECYDGCGAPLVDGVCEHCGRVYKDLLIDKINDIIEAANQRLDKVENDFEEVVKTDLGPSYEPGLMESQSGSWNDGKEIRAMTVDTDHGYPFEDTQKMLGVATVSFLLIGGVFGLFAPPLALPFLIIGLLAAMTGFVRNLRHKESE